MNYVKIAHFVDRQYAFVKNMRNVITKSSYAKKRLKMIGGGYKGSEKEYRETVLSYWRKYSQHPKKYWYQLLCNGEGKFDPRYIPDSMWYGRILPYFNNTVFRSAYSDKTLFDIYFRDLKRPVTLVKNTAGHYYDKDGQWICREEAEDILVRAEGFIAKPALNSGGGKGVLYIGPEEVTPEKVRDILDSYRANFVVQALVKQHADLARIHAGSLNTVRVMSLHFKGKVHVLSAQLRMGAGESHVDNISSGGVACVIVNEQGQLADRAVTRKSEWSDHHPSGIKFKDIVVPSYGKILETVRKAHKKVPYYNLIGWDFAVDEVGDPVFIEFNVGCEQNQIAGGPTFGDMTDEVLEDVFIKKTLKDVFI